MLLELSAMISLELDAAASDELLNSGSPQPSGGQYTPYRGCAVFSLVQLAQKKAVVVRRIFFQCLRMFILRSLYNI